MRSVAVALMLISGFCIAREIDILKSIEESNLQEVKTYFDDRSLNKAEKKLFLDAAQIVINQRDMALDNDDSLYKAALKGACASLLLAQIFIDGGLKKLIHKVLHHDFGNWTNALLVGSSFYIFYRMVDDYCRDRSILLQNYNNAIEIKKYLLSMPTVELRVEPFWCGTDDLVIDHKDDEMIQPTENIYSTD